MVASSANPLARLGEVQERLVVRRTQVRHDRGQPGVMGEQRRERRRAGVGRGHRRVPGVHHHRHARLCQQPPDRPQPGLVGREAAHLQMHLEDARSGVERCIRSFVIMT
jgi:hypothetical protein